MRRNYEERKEKKQEKPTVVLREIGVFIRELLIGWWWAASDVGTVVLKLHVKMGCFYVCHVPCRIRSGLLRPDERQ